MQALPPKGTCQYQEKKLKKNTQFSSNFEINVIFIYKGRKDIMTVYDDYNDSMIDGIITDDDDTITCGEY